MTTILHIIPHLSLGGASRALIAAAKYSSRQGSFSHWVVSLRSPEAEAVDLAQAAGLEVRSAPDFAALSALLSEADIVQVHYWNHPLLHELFRRDLPPMRLVLWYHVAGDTVPHIISPDLARFADLNIPTNPYSFSQLSAWSILPEEVRSDRLALVIDPADLERVEGVGPVPHTSFNVGYIGSVDFSKMHRRYVPMSASVRVPNVRFIVCGRGIEQQLRDEATQLGAADRFDFKGYVEDIRSVIGSLDVYGYPLCPETYASGELNLQEVMAAGIPPVVFPHGGVRGIIRDGDTGLVVRSESEYRDAIEFLYHNKDERLRIGRNAAARASTEFGGINAAKKLNPLYAKLAECPKRDRVWGATVNLGLLDQPIRLTDLDGAPGPADGASVLVDSLGDHAGPFAASFRPKNDLEAIAADEEILRLPEVAHQTGVLPYRDFYRNDAHLQLWAGLGYAAAGRFDAALREFEMALANGLRHWRVQWQIARAALRLGREDRARAALGDVLAAAPRFAPALEMSTQLNRPAERDADSHSENGADSTAKTASLDYARTGGAPHVDEARAALARGDGDAACDSLARAVEADPTQPDLWRALGSVQAQKGDLPSATHSLSHAIDLEPGDIDSLVLIARMAIELENAELFEQALSGALTIDGNHPGALGLYAQACARTGRHAAAVGAYQSALRGSPEDPELWMGLGESLDATGQTADAEEARAQFNRLVSEHLENTLSMGSPAVDERPESRPAGPDAADGEMAPVGHPAAEPHLAAASAALDAGDPDGACDGLRKARNLAPRSVDIRMFLGNIEFQRGNIEAASAEFESACQLEPTHRQARIAAATALRRLRDFAEAQRHLQCVLATAPEDIDVLKQLAHTLNESGNWLEAAPIYARIIDSNPGDHETILALGAVFFRAGELDAARTSFDEVLRLAPGHPVALENLRVLDSKSKSPSQSQLDPPRPVGAANPRPPAPAPVPASAPAPAANSVQRTDAPDVSIVVATKNRAALLSQMLASIDDAVGSLRCEIIVVAGDSADETDAILARHGSVRVFSESRHLGAGRHSWPQLYNFGFGQACGRWAMFASDDILFHPECLSRAVAHLDVQSPEVAGGIFFYRNQAADPGWDRFGIDYTYGPKLLLNYGLFRLTEFRAVGGLDERYRFYCADGDLCFKLYEKGKTLIPLNGCFVVHDNVLDIQKSANLDGAREDIRFYKERWKHFVSMSEPDPRRLLWKDVAATAGTGTGPGADNPPPAAGNGSVSLAELRRREFWREGNPLRLHLGCGEQHLNGYVNIDYPPSEHSVQNRTAADLHGDITLLEFPDGSVDEIRLHHVFEHFDRATALALLCKWHEWLKPGGRLWIETPDLMGCLDLLRAGECSHREKQVVLRHLFGSHEARWAVHWDGWYEAKYRRVLTELGYEDLRFEGGAWKMTRNISVQAVKGLARSRADLRRAAETLLSESLVDDSESELRLLETWRSMLARCLGSGGPVCADDPSVKAPGSTLPRPGEAGAVPVVSIFMPVYNREQYLSATIESIRSQTFEAWELVIADDGSTDGTCGIARRHAEGDARIKVLELPHRGEVVARNEALRRTDPRSRYLMNHDSDDLSEPSKLATLVEVLESEPDIGGLGCDARYFDDQGADRGAPSIEHDPRRIRQTFGTVNSMIHSATLFRRELLETVGGYRESFRTVDDYDLFARALLAGFWLANLPFPLHRIRLHAESVGSTRAGTQKDLAERVARAFAAGQIAEPPEAESEPSRSAGAARSRKDSPLSILATVEFYAPRTGGAETVVQQISERLARRGHRVTVATSAVPERAFTELNGVEIRGFDVTGKLATGIGGTDAAAYQSFLRAHRPDVLFNYAAQQWATDLTFNTIRGCPPEQVNVLAPCGFSALRDSQTLRWPQFHDYFQRILPAVLPAYDGLVFHSSRYQDFEYAARLGLANGFVIPNGTDENEFSTAPAVDFRRKHDIQTQFMGLCVANFYPDKGHTELIESVRAMNRPNFTLVLIGRDGDDDLLARLGRQAEGLPVRLLKNLPREDTLAAFHAADLFLFASRIEASPLVILEAKASRTPFISTNCGNVHEWSGGVICEPDAIAATANRLLDSPAERRALAEAGHREWHERFTWDSIVDQYEDLFLRLRDAKGRSRGDAPPTATPTATPTPIPTPAPIAKSTVTTPAPAATVSDRPRTNVIVFSKDRALQLDATLTSFARHCEDRDNARIHVLFASSDPRHDARYTALIDQHPDVRFVRETRFKDDVITLLKSGETVLFAVDDCLFVRPFHLGRMTEALAAEPEAIGFSARLGRNTIQCYPLNRPQETPEFTRTRRQYLKFDWTRADADFGYPLELSSSLYRTDLILDLVSSLDFHNPNTLEKGLAESTNRFATNHPLLLCSELSTAFCIPANVVQSEFPNRSGANPDWTSEALGTAFDEGRRIDTREYDNLIPAGCHQEEALRFGVADAPTVSVVVPCYNQGRYLPEAVRSVIDQSFADWECIIVNDGSPDTTATVAEELVRAFPDHRIRLLNKPNGGLADARNAGIRAARGEFILPLDADDRLDPEFLTRTLGALRADQAISIAYTDRMRFGAETGLMEHPEYSFPSLCQNNQLNYCALFRRIAWVDAGGYNPNMTHGFEDWDFWIGCGARGHFARRIPEPLFHYRVKEESMYTDALAHDRELRARIVLNHADLYTADAVRAAEAILAESGGLERLSSGDTADVQDAASSKGNGMAALMREAEAAFARNDAAAARVALAAALEIAPDQVEILETLGCIDYQSRAFDSARTHFRRVVELTPDNAGSWVKLALTCGQLGDFGEFESALSRALQIAPDNPEALKALAESNFRHDRFTDAAPVYGKLLQSDPDNIDLLLPLAVCFFRTGDTSMAREVFERVVQLEPGHPVARENLAALAGQSVKPESEPEPGGEDIRKGYSFCIITNGKRPAKLRREIDSIRNQKDAPPFEILVGGAVPDDLGADVRIVSMPDHANGGRLGAMRNRLVDEARFDRVIVADDDLIFHDGFFRGLAAGAAREDADVICVRFLNPDGSRFWDWATHGGPRGHSLLEYGETDSHVYVTGGLCIARRSMARSVRWNDTRGFYEGEDVEFSRRLRDAGAVIRFNPECRVTHDDPGYTQRGKVVERIESVAEGRSSVDGPRPGSGEDPAHSDGARSGIEAGAATDGARLPVRWMGPVFNPSGYASECINFLLPLAGRLNLGLFHHTEVYSEAFVRGLPENDRDTLFALRDRFASMTGGIVVSHNPAHGFARMPDAEYHVGRTMFETREITRTWVTRCNLMDEIWVPSRFNAETFAASGVERRKLHVIPGAIDDDLYNPELHTPYALPNRAGYNFLAMFEWSLRKGWDTLLAAYFREFSAEDDVCLFLRTYLTSQPDRDPTLALKEKIRQFADTLDLGGKPLPRVRILDEQIATSAMPGLYLAADCLVAPSRGEGWGRPHHEAMMMERPVIATNWSGNTEFMTSETSYLLDYELVRADHVEPEIWHYRGHHWAEPSGAHLRQLMREVQQDPERARERGQAARRHMLERFSRGATADRVVARLQEIERQLLSPTLPAALARIRSDSPSASDTPAPSHQKPAATIQVAWDGSFLDFGSLSHVNRNLCRELESRPEIRLTRIGKNTLPNNLATASSLQQTAKKLRSQSPASTQVTVHHGWPPNWQKPSGDAWVVIQPWEYGALPSEWVRQLQRVDQVWAPTEHVRRTYVDSGIAPEKVKIVPNGVDPDQFSPSAKPLELNTDKRFKFLFVGGTIHRKGPDLLLKAFMEEFGARDDVCLVIKDFGGGGVYSGQTMEDQIRAVQARADTPEIVYLTDDLDPEQLPGLYTACDCLVHPYRGEGFGLPALEAMSCARPIIVTGGGATDDFATDNVAYRIPARRNSLGMRIANMDLERNGWILEPDLMALRHSMRHVVSNPDEAAAKGRAAREQVESQWTWKDAANIAAGHLRELVVRKATQAERLRERRARKAPPIHAPATARIGWVPPAEQFRGDNAVDEAWQHAVEAIQRRPFNPEAYLFLAQVAHVAGEVAEARRCARIARQLAPNWRACRKLIKTIGQSKRSGGTPLRTLPVPETEPRLSVCLITRNEEEFLDGCLTSLSGIAWQIVVLDTGSTDRTVEIAKKHGAEVHRFTWCDDFSAARNAALEHVTGDWVLCLDADEELVPDSIPRILDAVTASTVMAYRVAIVDKGREAEGRSYVPRLFRNAPGLFFVGRVHEQVFSSLEIRRKEWGLENRFSSIELLHHGYTKEVTRDRKKIIRNILLLERAVEEMPNEPNLEMNLGLELVRLGRADEGIERYREAFELLSAKPTDEVVPELRESILTQLGTQLLGARRYEEIIEICASPLARNGGLTASMHFILGLAHQELRQFGDAARHLRRCISKRDLPCLSPVHKDIHGAGPYHCLGLCLAATNSPPEETEKAFKSAISDDPSSRPARFDYARFHASRGHFVKALSLLNKLIGEGDAKPHVWHFGAEIALSKDDLLDFAADWTGEAIKHFPSDTRIRLQRAQALILSGKSDLALPLWDEFRLSADPSHQAARVLCHLLNGKTVSGLGGADQTEVSRSFVKLYRRLLQIKDIESITRLNARLDALDIILPTASAALGNALREADTAVAG